MNLFSSLFHALNISFAMTWGILWALILGFLISAAIQAVVSKEEMGKLLKDASVPSLIKACGLGAASSSCSYAAVAIARSIFRKGGDFTAAIVFQFASTNLVIELGILLAILLAWQFTLAEFVGGMIMVAILAWLFKGFLKKGLVEDAKRQANKGLAGIMEEHAEMEMNLTSGSFIQRLASEKGLTAVSHYFVMDWQGIWFDIVLGLLIAGAAAAWIPEHFWKNFFLTSNPTLAIFWGPVVGPMVAIASFVCSIGNVPLAAVLWNGGISFGGVVAFIFADLLILPILNIYRKYYGGKMTFFLFITSYIAIVLAALAVELLFSVLGLVPQRHAVSFEGKLSWNYTTFLNIGFLLMAGFLLSKFFKTGGVAMMKGMQDQTDYSHHHDHHG